MRCQSAAEAFITSRNLNRLILHVVVRLANRFLVLEVLVGHASVRTLVVVARLSTLKVFESVASLRSDRSTVLLVAFCLSSANHKVVFVLLIHW